MDFKNQKSSFVKHTFHLFLWVISNVEIESMNVDFALLNVDIEKMIFV